MKTGIVLEGGAMRGMFTAGVLDVMMEQDITFDGAVGVSAGAVFGCNYKSRQPGRVIRYNKRYCRDPRYVSNRSLLKTGDLYGENFCYHELPDRLDPFDAAAYRKNPMEFYVVCTDALTGEAVYHRCGRGDARDLQWMRASASMPMVSKLVELEGRLLSDGGTADSIPVRFLEGQGYRRIVAVLTQPKGFSKQPNKLLPLLRVALRNYPALVRALEVRHERYNETLRYLAQREREGSLLVLRPSQALKIGAVERDAEQLERVYQIGRADALAAVSKIHTFLCSAAERSSACTDRETAVSGGPEGA